MASEQALAYNKYLRRIEGLAGKLLRGKFGDAEGIWTLQLDILSLQQDLQGDIKTLKAVPSGDQNALDGLRWARAQARRLGDAFAWVILGAKPKTYPLAANSSVPIPGRGPSSETVVKLARTMWIEGWGFPLLHDITDLLRIGDISFVNHQRDLIHTVEVKSKLVREDPDGSQLFDVTAHFAGTPALTSPSVREFRTYSGRKPARLEKQLTRINEAKARQDAPMGEILKLPGGPTLMVAYDSDELTHWELIRRACRKARRSGYAFEVADQAFGYAVFYESAGIQEATIQRPDLPEDLVASGVLACSNAQNSILIVSIPRHYSRVEPELSLPFFFYPLPWSTIRDLLNGRMSIMIMANVGKVVEAYRSAGLSVVQTLTDSGCELTISSRFEGPQGDEYNVELHHAQRDYRELLLEARSLTFFVDRTATMLESAKSQVFSSKHSPFNGGSERR